MLYHASSDGGEDDHARVGHVNLFVAKTALPQAREGALRLIRRHAGVGPTNKELRPCRCGSPAAPRRVYDAGLGQRNPGQRTSGLL